MGLAADLPADVLDALFLPLTTGELACPADGRVLFAGARAGVALQAFAGPSWRCAQTFRPFARELESAGLVLDGEADDARCGLVLLLPPRQRDARRAAFARALERLAPGGTLLACIPNTDGARSGESDLARLAGPLRTLSKHKCRVFWTTPGAATVDPVLQAEWLQADAPRRNVEGFLSRPGLFAWDHVDPASALLAAHLPVDLAGRVADLGAGYGYLAAQIAGRCPQVTAIDLYEAEATALPLAEANVTAAAQRAGRRLAVGVHWHDVTEGLPGPYDAIVSNPPFHQGRADLPALGQAFIDRAAAALRPGGRLWLVANRHLPYEATLAARFDRVRVLAERDGFKVLEGSRA